jgi:mRNA interferase MazF
MVSRGDVWLVDLDPAGDRMAVGVHPCVILSPPEIHDYLGLVTVAPISEGCRPAGFRVPAAIPDRPGMIRLEQVRTVDKRLLTRQVGALEQKTLTTALATLREMFAE